jgi:PKD repeat protein
MKNMLLPIGLFLLVVLPLTANDLKDRSGPNKPGKDVTTIPKIGQDLYILGPSVDYDAVLVEENAMPARSSYRTNRNLADTLAYVPADGGWNAQFIQDPGDAMLVMFKMPADGIIKGVNVPVYDWGTTGDQELTLSLHKVSYPSTSDGGTYPLSAVDGNGWIGGYDMDANGHMSIEGTTYTAGGTEGICDPGDAVVAGSQDPLGDGTAGSGPSGVPTNGLVWPDGTTSAVLTPDANPAQADNWMATVDFGDEPTLLQDEWIGVLFHFTGAGGGDDPFTGFYYEEGNGVVDPWVFAKFYHECTGTSGNGGWHIRHWMVNAQLAVELTGDRGPVFGEMTELGTTISTDDRSVSVAVTDDNPDDGSAAGVESVTLAYQLDSLTATVNSVSLSMIAGTAEDGTWEGYIPGQALGSTVYWSLTATDVNGNSTSSGTFSYFIFQPTAGATLLFNNQEVLYGNMLYIPYVYFYWGWSDSDYDIWDLSYGNLTEELVSNYDVIIELGSEPTYNADNVISNWWGPDKTYIVAGDEWLGVRYGWSSPTTIPDGDVAREILGIETYYPDISGSSSAISRLNPISGDDVVDPLYDFVDSVGGVLNYDPQYDPGHSNWLDGVDAVDGYHVAMTGYSGALDSADAVPIGEEVYNVMIYSNVYGKSAFLAFDPVSLMVATNDNDHQYWVGAHNYQGYNVSPLGLVYEWADSVSSSQVLYANFFANPTSGDLPLSVQFTDLSTIGDYAIQEWYWDFQNDGTYDSFEQNPTFTYTDTGSYDVKLMIYDGSEYETRIREDYITVTAPPGYLLSVDSVYFVHGDTAIFPISNLLGYPALNSIDLKIAGFQGKLGFVDLVTDSSTIFGSLGWITQYNNTDTLFITASAGANPVDSSGVLFALKLAVPDTLSSQFIPITITEFTGNEDFTYFSVTAGGVQVVWGPTVGYTATQTTGAYPLEVTFTDTSHSGTYPITTWSWDFGDDSTSSESVITHTYNYPGVYDVSLRIEDEFSLMDSIISAGLIQVDTLYGDVSWNAQVQSYDASLILQDLVDMIELDDMQVTVADVSTDNTLSTLDATLILQYVVGTISTLPYDAGSQYVASGNVSMDDRGTGPGIPINIPLHISNGSNVYGFEMKVEFDHTLLEFDTLVLTELMDNYLLIYNSDTDGELIVAASGSNPDGETGSFGTLTFNVSANFSDETVVSITRLRLNEGPVVENPASMTVSYALGIDSELLPHEFALHQNYPNPFNPVTTLRYDLPENGLVTIIIYDMLGREVKTLINQNQDAGYRSVIWNATNDAGQPVSAGIYLYQIQAGEYMQTKKMVLLK